MTPLYLVDGSGYIFRAYYAVPVLSNSSGLPVNALHGFSRMLGKLLGDIGARHIAVAFDTAAPTFRHELYSEYKANRGECPEDLKPQMPFFRDIVRAFGIACYEKEGFEADDIIGTLTSKFASSQQKVVIVSGDKDLTQLVNPNVEVWDAMRDIHYDEDSVEKKFGVRPDQIIDYLALRGDSSDNIPGVKGIGEKTAVRLLQELGSVESILKSPASIEEIEGLRGKAGVRKKIEASEEDLAQSLELVKLDLGVEPFFSDVELKDLLWEGPSVDSLQPLAEQLEIKFNIPRPDGESVKIDSFNNAPAIAPEDAYKIVKDSNLEEFLQELESQSSFAFDTETTSLNTKEAELIGVSFSWSPEMAWYWPLLGEGEACLDKKGLERLKAVFSNPKVEKCGLNLKYDISILREAGFEVAGSLFDVMIASHLLSPDTRGNGLKRLAKVVLGQEMKTFEETLGDCESLLDVEQEKLACYAAHDARASWELSESFRKRIFEGDNKKLGNLFQEIEMPALKVLVDMELSGVSVDYEYLASLGKEFSQRLFELEKRIVELAGEEFNLNSPKQLAVILFEKLKIPTTGIKKNKTGYSTDSSVLLKLVDDYEIIAELIEYRELFKLNSTYVESLQKLLNPDTGRIHSSFNQAITATGRLSSSDPNLQNIPIKNPRGRQIRKAFSAPAGKLLVAADYSQIELRVLAHLAEDAGLIASFNRGEDIHLGTAREVFGPLLVPEDADSESEEIKEMRRVAKTINFGVLYGMSGFRLARELKIPRKKADEFIDTWFAKFSGVRDYFESLERDIQELGYVETMYGRRRFSDDIKSTNRDKGYKIRSLMNAPIQGTAAEIMKIAMVSVSETLKKYSEKAKIILQVHDELVVEVDESLAGEVEALVGKQMEAAVELLVPLKVDTVCSKQWG